MKGGPPDHKEGRTSLKRREKKPQRSKKREGLRKRFFDRDREPENPEGGRERGVD